MEAYIRGIDMSYRFDCLARFVKQARALPSTFIERAMHNAALWPCDTCTRNVAVCQGYSLSSHKRKSYDRRKH